MNFLFSLYYVDWSLMGEGNIKIHLEYCTIIQEDERRFI